MLDKLVGPNGALWRTGEAADADASTTSAPSAAVPPASTPVVSVYTPSQSATNAMAGVPPEILEATRKAAFEIPGSIYARFATEMENLQDVIVDPTTRIKAVVKTLRVSPAEIIQALTSTHCAALEAWKASVARAKDDGHAEKVTAREKSLEAIDAENARLQEEANRLLAQVQANTEKARTLRQEVDSAKAEIAQKAQQYNAAVTMTEQEIAHIVSTLQSIS